MKWVGRTNERVLSSDNVYLLWSICFFCTNRWCCTVLCLLNASTKKQNRVQRAEYSSQRSLCWICASHQHTAADLNSKNHHGTQYSQLAFLSDLFCIYVSISLWIISIFTHFTHGSVCSLVNKGKMIPSL